MQKRMLTFLRPATVVLLLTAVALAVPPSSGPGNAVFSSILRLWNIAPDKFRPVMSEKDWEEHTKRYKMTKSGIKEVRLDYDVAEFGEVNARISEAPASVSKDTAPDYVLSATKHFDSDAACLAYYTALVDGFAARLAADKIKRSDRRDHVFFKDKREKYERKLYVKHYTKQKGKKKPRVIVSVRVSFRG